jgi:hypothetical protein
MEFRFITFFFHVTLSIREEVSDLFLRLTHVFTEDFWTMNYFWLLTV